MSLGRWFEAATREPGNLLPVMCHARTRWAGCSRALNRSVCVCPLGEGCATTPAVTVWHIRRRAENVHQNCWPSRMRFRAHVFAWIESGITEQACHLRCDACLALLRCGLASEKPNGARRRAKNHGASSNGRPAGSERKAETKRQAGGNSTAAGSEPVSSSLKFVKFVRSGRKCPWFAHAAQQQCRRWQLEPPRSDRLPNASVGAGRQPANHA
jgi:hypothetical protein